MRQNYTISEEDWAELIKLSKEAITTPVIALSVADGISGNDFSARAHSRVYEFWESLGRKYGFAGRTAEPVDSQRRTISAEPATEAQR